MSGACSGWARASRAGSRFLAELGMTDRKATARATANTEILRFALDDGENQAGARAEAGAGPAGTAKEGHEFPAGERNLWLENASGEA